MRGEEEHGKTIIYKKRSPWFFTGWVVARGKGKKGFSFFLGSLIIARHESSPLWFLTTFNWVFCSIIILCPTPHPHTRFFPATQTVEVLFGDLDFHPWVGRVPKEKKAGSLNHHMENPGQERSPDVLPFCGDLRVPATIKPIHKLSLKIMDLSSP